MQTTAIGTVAKSLPQNVVILLTLLIPKRYIPYTDLRKKKSLTLNLGKKQTVNYCIIQENIKNGERIRQYKIEAKVNGKWQSVCSGESVGHKRIEKFDPIEATALRLTIPESVALPDIINFSTYYIK